MHRLVLHNLGPVKDCDINVNDFMVFTGPQASGKSTIAKAVFFFRTVKDEILDCIIKCAGIPDSGDCLDNVNIVLRDKFYRLFTSFLGMEDYSEATFYYSETAYISVFCYSGNNDITRQRFEFNFSDSIQVYLRELQSRIEKINLSEINSEKKKLNMLFSDKCSSLFIPANRSMITLFMAQLNSMFAKMDDQQKSRVDYCTTFYIFLIQSLYPSFVHGIGGFLMEKLLVGNEINTDLANRAEKLIGEIIKGRYWSSHGIDRLSIGPESEDKKSVTMNQASSGQQEAVWITNIIFYYLFSNTPVFLIVEEPESNLYPDTQKKITELLSLFRKAGNQVLITTHSPYVLGTLNNLIYASDIAERGVKGVEKIIDSDCWLEKEKVSAWHIENGIPDVATEGELGLIRNEDIDGASIDLTDESDALYELSAREE